jgi:hypothetical protein
VTVDDLSSAVEAELARLLAENTRLLKLLNIATIMGAGRTLSG